MIRRVLGVCDPGPSQRNLWRGGVGPAIANIGRYTCVNFGKHKSKYLVFGHHYSVRLMYCFFNFQNIGRYTDIP